jgi:uncharacterized protein YajQ (UPF0234 family)
MAKPEVETVTVEDSQHFQDAQSQHDMDPASGVDASVAPVIDGNNGDRAPDEEDERNKEAMEAENTNEKHSEADAGNGDGVNQPEEVEQTQLVEDDAEDHSMHICRKCQIAIEVDDAVARGPDHVWCRSCNAIYTTLQRHQAFPPKSFSELSEQQQVAFWRKCLEQKDGKTFRYTTLRNILVNKLVEETIKVRRLSVGGTYEPKSVLVQQGYDLSDEILQDMPKEWNASLRDWTYLLVKTSVNEESIFKTIDAQIVQAERLVKKKRHAEIKNETPSEPSAIAGLGAASVSAASATEAPASMDLDSDDEGSC